MTTAIKKILLTGASGGFGKETTRALLAAGHQVAATLRDIDGRNRAVAEALRSAGAKVIDLDVTSDDSVGRGVQAAISALGGLDVLVNNAGVGVLGLQEAFTAEDMRRVFDINVFGVQRMNRAVLPLMREQGQGLIVYVSSLLGRMTMPFYGPYNATKWALEGLAETYRCEVSQLGIESCIVEPGGYATTFMDNLVRPSDTARQQSYGAMAGAPQASLDHFAHVLANTPAQDPANVTRAIVGLIDAPHGSRPFRTAVDALGMAQALTPYNDMLQGITTAIYGHMGMSALLQVKTRD